MGFWTHGNGVKPVYSSEYGFNPNKIWVKYIANKTSLVAEFESPFSARKFINKIRKGGNAVIVATNGV